MNAEFFVFTHKYKLNSLTLFIVKVVHANWVSEKGKVKLYKQLVLCLASIINKILHDFVNYKKINQKQMLQIPNMLIFLIL